MSNSSQVFEQKLYELQAKEVLAKRDMTEERIAALRSSKCPLLPMEFNVVVEPDKPEEKTAGGIILTSTSRDADELAADEGTLVAVSPHAFTYAEWPEGARKPQVGDRVIFARYAGVLRKPKGSSDGLRILKDKDIMAVIMEQANG
jgi:co-chaperonin GroES (HSP10)